ncbi:hypothetical protein LFM09_23195 [Lentzea alba]|uniref:hypothetical protein n=1 Tax=Lentzea alba TaxID=2714351 RepID=UPI0039BFA522
MKRLAPVLGALVLVGAVVAVVMWHQSEPAPKYVVLQYADGSELWRTGDPETPLVRQVVRELGTRASLSLDELRKTGAVVVTTIDAKAQSGAMAVIRESSAALQYSITAVDPASGAVRTYAPGNDPAVDYAGGVVREPGAAFFPFDAVALVQDGKALSQTADPRKALRAAQRAGVPEFADIEGTRTKLLDGSGLRPFDLASAYATLAADGVHRDAHFVTHVSGGDGATLHQARDTPQPAFDRDALRSKDISGQVTRVLRDDPACGDNPEMACRTAALDRHAWMVACTPQLSVSVFVGGEQAVDVGLPKALWQKFLEKLKP